MSDETDKFVKNLCNPSPEDRIKMSDVVSGYIRAKILEGRAVREGLARLGLSLPVKQISDEEMNNPK